MHLKVFKIIIIYNENRILKFLKIKIIIILKY